MPARQATVTVEQVRAFWAAEQGVSRPVKGGAESVVRASGWMYSPGSTLPYLAFRARMKNFDRGVVDRAVFAEASVVEVPAVRACSMLVPAEDVALALAGSRRLVDQHLDKVRTACDIREREVQNLCAAVPTLLKDGPLTMESLRARLPVNLVRDLGSAGRKFGERSTLTFTVRLLQRQMIVQRAAVDRRLDSESYSYRLLPRELVKDLPPKEADRALADHFFGWAAPATLKEFAWWAGMSQKEARGATEQINLASISIEGWTKEAWIPRERLDALHATKVKNGPSSFLFLPVRDNYLYFRRGIGVFLDPDDWETRVLDWRNRPARLADLDSIHHNIILEGNRLAGYWEYDPEGEEVVWQICGKLHTSQQRKVESEVAGLEDFIRSQLGDVAFYAFDRGKNRRQRIDSLK